MSGPSTFELSWRAISEATTLTPCYVLLILLHFFDAAFNASLWALFAHSFIE